MREGVSLLRERGRSQLSPRSSLSDFLARHRPSWALGAAGGLLLAGVDAFGSGGAPPATLFSYWLAMMLVTAFVLAATIEILEAWPALAARPLALYPLAVVGLAAAMTPLVWVVAAVVLGGSTSPAKMAVIFPQALLIGSAFAALQWTLERRGVASVSPAPAPGPARRPAILDRLPEKLRGAELLALEAEDHYLRFHTSQGSALLLMRLADAMAALQGLEGGQTHRSWWVARAAIVEASRGRGRALLRLKGGLEAPVSRTYAPALRRAGWF